MVRNQRRNEHSGRNTVGYSRRAVGCDRSVEFARIRVLRRDREVSLNGYSKPAFFWKDAMGLGRCIGLNATKCPKDKDVKASLKCRRPDHRTTANLL